MKIAIIYSTSSGITKKAAKILSNKIKAKIQLIPIEKAKTACLLKYDFIILAGSLYHGKVQGILKRYISRNMGTLMEKPVALFMNCDEKSNTKSHLNKTSVHFLSLMGEESGDCTLWGLSIPSNKKAGAPFPARLIAVSLPPEKALISNDDICCCRTFSTTLYREGNLLTFK